MAVDHADETLSSGSGKDTDNMTSSASTSTPCGEKVNTSDKNISGVHPTTTLTPVAER